MHKLSFPGLVLEGILILAIFLLPFIPAVANAKPQFTARITYQPPYGDQLSNLMVRWAEEVEKGGGGRIEVILYPGSQLIQSTDELLFVARDQIQGALISPYYWGRTLPVMSVISRPFSFPDDEAWRGFAVSELRNRLDAEVETKGMRNLFWIYISRFLAITSSSHPLVNPDDFTGTKLRGLGPITDVMFESIGAIPVFMSGGEAYQALQTRMIDGALTSLPSTYVRRFYEVQQFVTVSPIFPGFFAVTVNGDWWNSLPPELQEMIHSVSSEIELESIDEAIERDKQTMHLLAQEGMIVHLQTRDEIVQLRELLMPSWTRFYLEMAGERGKQFLQYVE